MARVTGLTKPGRALTLVERYESAIHINDANAYCTSRDQSFYAPKPGFT